MRCIILLSQLISVYSFITRPYVHQTHCIGRYAIEFDDEPWPCSNEENYEKDDDDNEEEDQQIGIRFIFPTGDPRMNGFIRSTHQGMVQKKRKIGNFEVMDNVDFKFDQVGGYENVKQEMMQCIDILKNYEQYNKFNVRTPKGLILEGPPGNGKTLLARAFSGETNASFIAVSGSEFQEKFVGVGASRMRELFELAQQNTPCIVFIDEVDAIGRARGGDLDSANAERDNTLNELLVKLDGFHKSDGVFVICATNRVDLLDKALMRPGRIDKQIYISNPDTKTREEIIKIHKNGKPMDSSIKIYELVEMTNGFSGAEIENLLNEGMLYAIRQHREMITRQDLEYVMGRSIAGFQANKNTYSDDMIRRIAIHELGHAVTGLISKFHSRMTTVNLNLWSPTTPGYTKFETDEIDANIFTDDKLFAHLVVLLSGRVAEDIFFNNSVTTGASKDFHEAYKLAEQMVVSYGMGKQNIYTYGSDKSKEVIDNEIASLLEKAGNQSRFFINEAKNLIEELCPILIDKQVLTRETIEMKIYRKYPKIFDIDR